MGISQEYKNTVKTRILEALVAALEKSEIATKELPDIGTYVIDGMKKIETKEHMLHFLQKLSAKWRIFSIVLVMESGEYKMQDAKDKKKLSDAAEFLRKGDVTDALASVKGVT